MRLRRLDIEHMPGIEPVTLEGFGPGITVVTGPNESGKTSLMLAVRSLLWQLDARPGSLIDVRAAFSVEADGRTIERVVRSSASGSRWEDADGASVEPPALPSPIHAGCFTIGHDDLTVAPDATGAELARSVATQLTGGVDMGAVRAALVEASPKTAANLREHRELREARAQVDAATAQQRSVRDAELALGERRAERDRLLRLRGRADQLRAAVAWKEQTERIAQLEAAIAALGVAPELLDALRDDDVDHHDRLRQACAKAQAAEAAARSAHAGALQVADAFDAEPLDQALVGELRARVVELRELEATGAEHRRELARTTAAIDSEAVTAPSPVTPQDAERARRLAVDVSAWEVDGRRLVALDVRGRSTATTTSPARAALIATAAFGAIASVWLALATNLAGWGLLLAVLACAAVGVLALRPRVNVAPVGDDGARRREHEAVGAELSERARVLAARTGFDGALDSPAAVAMLLERLVTQHAAAVERAGIEARLEEVGRQLEGVRAALAERLAGLGLPMAADATAAAAAIEHLLDRDRARSTAHSDVAHAASALASAVEAAAEARAELERFRTQRGLPLEPDETAAGQLTERVRLAARFRSLAEQRAAATAARTDAEQGLDPADRAELLTIDPGALRDELAAAGDANERLDVLLPEIRLAEEAVRAASAGHVATDALAAFDDARLALEDARAAALRAATATMLVDWVTERYERDASAPLLESTNAILGAATHGRYAITAAAGAIAARDQRAGQSRIRPLAELSGGTRAQLLLAARIAFARHAEGSERLPLFVDEALTTTDEPRFRALVEALADVAARDQRQVLYLSSNPTDVARIDAVLTELGLAPAAHVDLVAARTGAALPAATHVVAAPPRLPMPEPGEASEEWASRIDVPRLDGFADVDAVHVWHVLEPDSTLVHRLLSANIRTVGQARHLHELGLLEHHVGDAAAVEQVLGAARAYEAFSHAWQHGRGRPIATQDALAAVLDTAGLRSQTWLEPLWQHLQAADGDARVLDTLWELPVDQRGFARAPSREKLLDLEDALRSHGHLVDVPPYDEPTLIALVARTMGDAGFSTPDRTLDELVRVWQSRADGRTTSKV